MNKTESLPSGVRLQQLIQNRHIEILNKERNNDRFIHLYNIGTYWIAFEQSACRLDSLFPRCELALFCVPGCTDYVVMVSVPVDAVADYFHKYKVAQEGDDYKVLSITTLETVDYYKWHEVAVRSVLQ